MLAISDDQLQHYRRTGLHRLDPRIDAWLLGQHPAWTALAPEQRQRVLYDMVEHADAAGMTSETDVALYCDLMVRVGPDWQSFATHPDAREIVADGENNPPMKLEELTELATEQAEDLAGR